MATSSRIMHHVTKLESFTDTRSHPNRASLGCGGTGTLYPGSSSHKSPSTARCYPIRANISKECFQHLVESMPHRIKAVLKAQDTGRTQY